MKLNSIIGVVGFSLISSAVFADGYGHGSFSDQIISEQRHALAENTMGKGFGPQSQRDIDMRFGSNLRAFGTAPVSAQMNLCNIHFHKNV